LNKKLGKIFIDFELLESDQPNTLDAFHAVGFLPVKTQTNYCSRQVEYVGICNKFMEVDPDGDIPTYRLVSDYSLIIQNQ